MQATILIFDGFDELDAIGPYRVLRGAAEAGADLDVSLRTPDPQDVVTAGKGLRVVPDGAVTDAGPDLFVVPGGGWSDRASDGAYAEAERGAVPDLIARYHAAGATIAGVCTGGMLIARAGVLDGRPAVTHASALGELAETNARVTEARVVDDGDVLTAGGVTSGIDLALHVVAREFGEEIANEVATVLEYDPRGPVHESTTAP